MRKVLKNWILALTAIVFTAMAAQAQYDDVYYDPDADDIVINAPAGEDNYYDDGYDYYDDESYSYYDDYDYHYTSRIRRFRRPNAGFGFYDPWFVDGFFYDPLYTDFWMPGGSIYFGFGGNDWWAWRRYQRWMRWNGYMYGYNPVSAYYAFNYCPPGWGWGWNRFNRPIYGFGGGIYSFNYYNNFFFNSCPSPVISQYGYNNYYVNSGEVRPNGVHYGPRRTGTVVSSPRGIVKNGAARQPVFKGDKEDVTARRGDFVKKNPAPGRDKTSGKVNVGDDGGKTTSIASEVRRRSEGTRKVTQRPVYNPKAGKKDNTSERSFTRDRLAGNDSPGSKRDLVSTERNRRQSFPERNTYRPINERRPDKSGTTRSYTPRKENQSVRNRSDASKRTFTPAPNRRSSNDTYNRSSKRSSQRSYSPARANRSSYGASRSGSSSSRSYSPSRSSSSSSRSYSPSRRSSSSSKSYSPSRSRSSSSKSYSPSRSSSSSRSSGSRSSSRSSSPRKNN